MNIEIDFSQIKDLSGAEDLTVSVDREELINLLRADGYSLKDVVGIIQKHNRRGVVAKNLEEAGYWRQKFAKSKNDIDKRIFQGKLDSANFWNRYREQRLPK